MYVPVEVHGGSGNDLIQIASAGVDRASMAHGGTGDDTLWARGGGAVLTGGAGADTFGLARWSTNDVTIRDFSQEDGDLIALGGIGAVTRENVQAMLDGSEGNVLNLNLADPDGGFFGTLTLDGVQVSDLTLDDFEFYGL